MTKIIEMFEQMVRQFLNVIFGGSVGYKPTMTTGYGDVGYDYDSPNFESDNRANSLRVANPQGLRIRSSINFDDNLFDIYTIQGAKVKSQANSEYLESLPAGIYIVNGKKIIK